MLLEIEKYFILFMFYSFVGWLWETCLCSAREKRFINRGFLNGPYCPIYGYGAIIDILVLDKLAALPYSIPIIFFASIVLTGILEYFTSYAMEKLFHARWWDYSNRKFNINGRVCLIGMLCFGTFSVLLLKLLYPFTLKMVEKIPPSSMHVIAGVLLFIYLGDNIITFVGIANLPQKIKALLQSAKDAVEERILSKGADKERDKKRFNISLKAFTLQEKRILSAFPKLKGKIKDSELFVKLKEKRNKNK